TAPRSLSLESICFLRVLETRLGLRLPDSLEASGSRPSLIASVCLRIPRPILLLLPPARATFHLHRNKQLARFSTSSFSIPTSTWVRSCRPCSRRTCCKSLPSQTYWP